MSIETPYSPGGKPQRGEMCTTKNCPKLITDRYHLPKLLKEQGETDKLEVFHQVLLSKGLLKEVKKPHVADTIERQLIEIKGKPISQTIIEERK